MPSSKRSSPRSETRFKPLSPQAKQRVLDQAVSYLKSQKKPAPDASSRNRGKAESSLLANL